MKNKEIKKQVYKLIALDMDGTLLNYRGEVSEENRRALAEAKEKGIHVVLCTGRSIMTCRPYSESLQLSSYLVTANGSEIWDPAGNRIEQNKIHADHIYYMWKLSQQHNTKFWAISTDRVWRQEVPEDIYQYQWLKFGFDIEHGDIRDIIFQELLSNPNLEVSNSSYRNIEVNASGIHKAKALEVVCKNIGITMNEVIAMGDSLNDIAMIRAAGCGVAMDNAQDVVKEAADWVTSSNDEDGVAKAIYHWVF